MKIKKPLVRGEIQLRRKGTQRLRRGQIIETQGLIKGVDLGGCHVTTAGYDVCVAHFDFHGKVKRFSHHFLHLRHQTRGDLMVHNPEATPLLRCFSQSLQLLLLLLLSIVFFQFLHINHRDTFPPLLLHLILINLLSTKYLILTTIY